MQFTVSNTRAATAIGETMEIATLEELIEFVHKAGHPVIIEEYRAGEWALEIYDDWRE